MTLSGQRFMEKRTFERITASIECHCFNIEYFGTVVNLSEKGMFIRSQKISFPLASQFYILISLNDEDTLYFRAKVNRLTKSNGYYDGIAVELLELPHKYLVCLDSLRLKMRV